ncbi:MAG: hypothetical protein C5S40_05945 [ANME-2 cluster archaeon]|nr:hypothetical protein [ANME-2 cluster archaeon]
MNENVKTTATAQLETGFNQEPYVVFQPANTKITTNEPGSVELYMGNPDINDATLHVCAEIYVPPNLYVYGLSDCVGGTGVVTTTFDIAPGKHKTVKVLIRTTRTGVYILDCNATYYPDEHKKLARHISSSYEMTVESIPTVTPTPGPTPTRSPGFEAMFVIASVLVVFYLLMRQK